MEFMLLFLERKGEPGAGREAMAAMKRLADELARDGTLRRGAPLAADSAGARVRVRDGRALVTDWPFAESKEALGGFWIVDVPGRDEALAIAGRCPHARHGAVSVHAVGWRDTVADPEKGAPYLLAYLMEPGLTDPDGSKMEEMVAHADALKRQDVLFETAPLAGDPPSARVEARDGKVLVTDGPFAETKDLVGGYGLVRTRSRAEAIELAKRMPHARWGPVEVREILAFDPIPCAGR